MIPRSFVWTRSADRTLRHSTTSMANQVSSSAATFLVVPEVWRAITKAAPMLCRPASPLVAASLSDAEGLQHSMGAPHAPAARMMAATRK